MSATAIPNNRERPVVDEKVDPITLEIIRHQLLAIPNLIERNVERTAFSPLIYEYKDYAVGFVDPVGRLVAQSKGSLPIFVANALGTAVKEGLAVLGEDAIGTGDVIITNSAAWLGQHLNNVVAYTPVRAEGRLVGFFAVLFHWLDIGGAVPGSCLSSETTDVWQEGIQFPTVRLVEAGKPRDDIFRLIRANSRFPDLLMGDIEAQLSGCQVGHGLVQETIARYGRRAVEQTIQAIWSDADARVGRVLGEARAGVYRASSFLDDDGLGHGPIQINVEVTVSKDRIVVDLSGLADQVAGPFNAGRRGGAIAAARIACKYLLAPDTPANEGDFTRLEVLVREGTFLSAAPDAPIGQSGSTVPTVVDTILRAVVEAFPSRSAAAHHGIYGLHAIYGKNETSGEAFQNLDTTMGGWGALRDQDGPAPFRSNGHGDVPALSVEMQEAFYPYRIIAQRIRTDSGGPGRQRGGFGVEKIYEVLQHCDLVSSFDRILCPPWGLEGGLPGAVAGVEIQKKSGDSELVAKGRRTLDHGDRIRVLSGGGGGYGPPHERDIEAVRRDVRLGYVSREAASRDYGVVIDIDGGIDMAATDSLRASSETIKKIQHDDLRHA